MKPDKKKRKKGSEDVVNIFDRASQLGMQLDPPEFFRCTLYRLDPDLVWGEWLKNHMVIDPDSRERRCDNVAKLVSRSNSQPPWACIAEAQGYKDSVFHPRVMIYKAGVRITARHGPRGRDRYPVMTLVLNLGDTPIDPSLDLLTRTLASRFPHASTADFEARIEAEKNIETLTHWFDPAMNSTSFQKFVAAIETNGTPK